MSIFSFSIRYGLPIVLSSILTLEPLVVNAASAIVLLKNAHDNGKSDYFETYNEPSKKIALEIVRSYCEKHIKDNQLKKAKCGPELAQDGPTYWALYFSNNKVAIGVGVDPVRQNAVNRAYQECIKSAGEGNCPDKAEYVWFDEGQKQVEKEVAPTKGKQCSPPSGKTLRYSDNCTNGACSRTFENGCVIQFQAPYCYDLITQTWGWKPDGCH